MRMIPALLLALAMACHSSKDSGKDTDVSDTDVTDTDTAGPKDTDDTFPILDPDHQGWRDTCCWDCHDKADTHNNEMAPYECAACHGSNGGPGGHSGAQPCAGCHDKYSNPHSGCALPFPDPESCLVCHPE